MTVSPRSIAKHIQIPPRGSLGVGGVVVSVLRFAMLPLPNYPVACTQWLAIMEHGRSVDLFQRTERPV